MPSFESCPALAGMAFALATIPASAGYLVIANYNDSDTRVPSLLRKLVHS